jgi:hypothetical protein
MKATEQDWINATKNLKARRSDYGHTNDNVHTESIVSNYRSHLEKCGYGSSILDVGCGSQSLKEVIKTNTKYIGLDAFPIEGIDCIHGAIEDVTGIEVDTVCAMAVLDNCRDFDKACQSMKAIARKNVIILTGIDIEVDKYHTFKLQLSDFARNFSDWDQTHYEEIQPKVWLLCYSRK